MKKIYAILFTVFLNMLAASCTPAPLQGDTIQSEDCCGESGEIPPPPPPPGNG